MISLKRDYRKGTRPIERKRESQNAIREALMYGTKNFGKLLRETSLSRPALASNLKEMCEKDEVERRNDSNDYRITYYSLTEKGRNEYWKQKDVESLKSAEFTPLRDPIALDTILEGSKKLAASIGQLIAELTSTNVSHSSMEGEDSENMRKSVRIALYFGEPLENEGENPLLKELEELPQSVKSSRSNDIQSLKKLSDVTLVFRFDRDNFIKGYMGYMRKNKAQKQAHFLWQAWTRLQEVL